MRRSYIASLLSATLLSGCTLAPHYKRPAMPVPQAWPLDGGQSSSAPVASAGDLTWREVFKDARLQGVIDLALRENRDLRIAAANIVKARATYRVQRAELLTSISANGSETRSRTPASVSTTGTTLELDQYSANIGLSSFELDLFGRIRSLSQAALQSYFAVEENRRTVQISLIAETATNYLTLAADQERLKLARDTLKTRDDGQVLLQKRFEAGATSLLEVRQAETLTEQSRSDVAAAAAQVEQDRNALRLVVGADIPPELMPGDGLSAIQVLEDLAAGVPSEVLMRRPDVLAAEHNLRGRYANIGAARAAFFPRISLTAATGVASPELDGLFGSGSGAWSFTPLVSVPLFQGGANIANLSGAKADKTIAVAQYEKTIQTAFREVADALAVRSTIKDRVGAQERLAAAAADALRLSQARYDKGVDAYLTLLDAQRTNYSSRQSLVAAQLLEAANRIELYRSLGGGAAR